MLQNATGQGSTAWAGNTAALKVDAGAYFDLWQTDTTVDYLAGTGAINKAQTGSNTLTIGVNNGSGTFGGVISDTPLVDGGNGYGTLNLVKMGSGMQTLSGANTFAGNTTVNGGTLQLGNANAVQNTAVAVNVNGGLTFVAGIGTFNVGSLGGSGNIVLQDSSSAQGAVALNVGGNNYYTYYSGNISGSGSLTKNGAGTMNLSGTNSYSGGTTINSGAIVFNSLAAIGGSGANVTANPGGTAGAGYAMDQNFLGRLAPSSGGVAALALDSSNNLNFSAFSTLRSGATGGYFNYFGTLTPSGTTYRLGGGGGTLNFAGLLSGADSVDIGVNGTSLGLVVLSNTNTYTGGTVINTGGEVSIASNLNIAGPASVITFNGGLLQITGTNLTSIDSHSVNWSTFNGGFDVNSAANVFTAGMNLGGSGGLTKAGVGKLVLSGTSTYSGGTYLNAGVTEFSILANLGSGGIVFNGGTLQYAPGNVSDITTRPVTLNYGGGAIDTNGNNVTFSNAIAGPGGLTKVGSGKLTLAGTDTYSGGTVVSGGILQVGSPLALGGTLSLVTSGVVDLNGINTTISALNDDTTGLITDYHSALGSPTVLTVNNVGSGTSYGGRIANGPSQAIALVVGGVGPLYLSGSNSYTGGTTIEGGATLSISNDLAVSGSTSSLTFSGGVLQVTGTSLQNLNAHAVNWSSFNGGFDVNNPSNTFTVSQSLGGGGSLSKFGAGTLVLSGSSSYTGGTTLYAGTTRLGNAAGLGNGSLYLVAGTLDLNGNSPAVTSLGGGFGALVTDNSAPGGPSLLTVNMPSGSSVYYGSIAKGSQGHDLALTKAGNGQLTLAGQQLQRRHDDHRRHPATRRRQQLQRHDRRQRGRQRRAGLRQPQSPVLQRRDQRQRFRDQECLLQHVVSDRRQQLQRRHHLQQRLRQRRRLQRLGVRRADLQRRRAAIYGRQRQRRDGAGRHAQRRRRRDRQQRQQPDLLLGVYRRRQPHEVRRRHADPGRFEQLFRRHDHRQRHPAGGQSGRPGQRRRDAQRRQPGPQRQRPHAQRPERHGRHGHRQLGLRQRHRAHGQHRLWQLEFQRLDQPRHAGP